MKDILKKHHLSFKYAFAGLLWALTTQPNFRIHILLSIIILFLSYYFRISHTEFIMIIFTIILGMATEMLNTSVEAVTDLVTKEWRQEAKIAKDVAAGMMLLVAFGSVIVASVIFVPYIHSYFFL